MAALLALAGALCWGTGDFFGGLGSRRAAVLTVLVVSQAVGLLGMLLWVAGSREPFPGVVETLPAVGAGIAGVVGLAALYRGLAIGMMGIVAPISAAAPIVPLTLDALQGVVPSGLQLAGIVLIMVGIVTLSREPSPHGGRVAAGVGLAVLAALGFGFFVAAIDVAADESAVWAVTVSRSTSLVIVAVAAIVLTAPLVPSRALLPMLVAIGVFDTAANVFVAVATTRGAAGSVAVLSALYPVVTIVLARVVLGERLGASRRAGAGAALVGAACVAAG
jgi:drug/metabolite transporter (DMT)-like permease